MAFQLEDILSKLLVPNNVVLQQATAVLKEAFKDPGIITALCNVIGSSHNPQVRQYAAVLLRRKVMKSKQWRRIHPDIRQRIKTNTLLAIQHEPEKNVCNALAQLAGSVAKHELPANRWPQLLQFLEETTHSKVALEKELGMFLLSIVSSVAGEQLKPHLKSLLSLFSNTLQDHTNPMVPFYTIQIMTHLVSCISSDEVHLFQILIPKVLSVIKQILNQDEDRACEALEIFDELVECEVSVIVPHIKSIIEFCMEVSSNRNYSNNIRVKAMSIISWLTRLKKKTIVKHKLVIPILNILFTIMCHTPEDCEEEEESEKEILEEAEAHTPSAFAAQVIDVMALHLPPEKLIPPLMRLVEPAFQHENPYHRKAGFLAMAVTAEGCADHICSKYLVTFLQHVYKGINDPSPVVANAALFALGQFAEHLQPDISKYASELLPILFNYLAQVTQEGMKKSSGISKVYYALEMFCENLESDILPYLPTLMDRLLTTLNSQSSLRIKELAISAIGATASAAKEEMLPYFPQILYKLKTYLTEQQNEATMPLQIQAIDTLGVLAGTLGAKNFGPLANECMQLGMKLVESVNDPDLRRSTYGLFGSISSVLKSGMDPYLPTLIPMMIESLQSTEGVKPHYGENNNSIFPVFEDLEDDEEEDDMDEEEIDLEENGDDIESDEDIQGYSVENPYLDEKEDTCCALKEIASNAGLAFLPYLELCYKEVYTLAFYPASSIRKAAVETVGEFCIALYKAAKEAPSSEGTELLARFLGLCVPKFIEIIKEDVDRSVVMSALETLNNMLNELKSVMLEGRGHFEGIIDSVRDALTLKTACQDCLEEEYEDLDDQQAEFDGILIEFAGDIIPTLARIKTGVVFAPYFAGFLPIFLNKTKKSCTVAERSFSVGTLAESVDAMGDAIAPFVQPLFPVFLTASKDDDDEVRNNAVYGLGLLAANGGDTSLPYYPTILKSLGTMAAHEESPRVLDNISAAVARMIIAFPDKIPIDQLFPALVRSLPLKEDTEEHITVFKCIARLYSINYDQIARHLPELLHIFAQILGTSLVNEEAQALLVQIIREIHRNHPEDFERVHSTLPLEMASKLEAALIC